MPTGKEMFAEYQAMQKTGDSLSGKDMYAEYQSMKLQPPPQPAASTFVDTRSQFAPDRQPDTLAPTRGILPTDPGSIGRAPMPTGEFLGKNVLASLGGFLANPIDPIAKAGQLPLQAILQEERGQQGLLTNLAAGGIQVGPYLNHPGAAKFILEIAADPKIIPEMVEHIGQAYQDVAAQTGTLEPGLVAAGLLQRLRGQPDVWGAIPKEARDKIIAEAKKGAGERIRTQPFETLLGLAAPVMGAQAVKGVSAIKRGARGLREKLIKTSVKPVKPVSEAMKPPEKAVASGVEVAGRMREMGTEGGLSGYEFDRISKKSFEKKEINLNDIIKSDKEFSSYVKEGKIREIVEDNLLEPPIIGETSGRSGQVIDGYNRLAQRYLNGERKVEAFVEITGKKPIKAAGKGAGAVEATSSQVQPAKKFTTGTIPKKIVIGEKDIAMKKGIERLRAARVTPTELGMFGSPESIKNLGQTAVTGMKAVSTATKDIIERTKVRPEIREGVKQTLEAMTEHDRWIRDAEFTSQQLKKTVKDAMPDAERQMLIVHSLEHGTKSGYWNKLTDSEKALTRWLKNEKTKLNDFIEKNDILELMKDPEISHLFHYWINPQSGKPYAAMYSKFSKGLPQAKQRKIRSYAIGMEATPELPMGTGKGMKPVTTNPGELIGLEWESAMRAHQSREMIKTLHSVKAEKGAAIELMRGKKPRQIRMIERWDKLQEQGLAEDYIRFDHPSLDKAITFKDAETGTLVRLKGAVGIRKEVHAHVNAYMNNPKYSTLEQMNFISKTLKLANPVFHPLMLAFQEVANLPRLPFKNIPRGLRLRKDLNNPDMRLLYREGLELFKGYEDVGYQNTFFDGVTTLGKVGNVATYPISVMRDFIFKVVQPGMKTSFAYDKLQKIRPKMLKKGYTESQIGREVVKMADGHFSGEHYKRGLLETNRFMAKLYFSPDARRTWQAILLSPTWQREHLLVAKDVVKSFMPDRLIKKIGLSQVPQAVKWEYRKYALGATLMIGSIDMYNMMSTELMDGEAKHIWENPPGKGFGVRAMWNEPSYEIETSRKNKQGVPIMRTVKGGPAYVRPLKSIYEVAEWFRDPFKKFSYKLSPSVQAVGRQIWPSKYQKEYKGVGDIPRRAKDFILDVSTPISVSQLTKAVEGKRTYKSAILSSVGFPVSKLSPSEAEHQFYLRMAPLDNKSPELQRLKAEFKELGFTFRYKKLLEYRKGK